MPTVGQALITLTHLCVPRDKHRLKKLTFVNESGTPNLDRRSPELLGVCPALVSERRMINVSHKRLRQPRLAKWLMTRFISVAARLGDPSVVYQAIGDASKK